MRKSNSGSHSEINWKQSRETNLLTRIYRLAEGEDSRVNIVDLEKPVTSEVLPVIIFFHGESFAHSSANSAIYDTRLVGICKVVVVSMNYRRAPENRYPCAYEDEKRLDRRYFVRVQDRDCHQEKAQGSSRYSPANNHFNLALSKALKNPVELDRLKKALIRDDASIVQLREKEAETQYFIGAAGAVTFSLIRPNPTWPFDPDLYKTLANIRRVLRASGFVKVAMKTKSYGAEKRSAACKSSSSSSIARRSYCACGKEVTPLKSNSVRNPRRMFWRCPNWDKEKNCGYFRWADDEATEQQGRLDDMEFIGQEQEQLKRKIGKLQLKLTVERRKVMVAECCVILCVAVNLVELLLCIVKCDGVRKNV
ncbi:Zinc finger, GRF-type [Sesbania bispinosa]|nr:Zinc finger, GRF-type [Sesbania bispinosa]